MARKHTGALTSCPVSPEMSPKISKPDITGLAGSVGALASRGQTRLVSCWLGIWAPKGGPGNVMNSQQSAGQVILCCPWRGSEQRGGGGGLLRERGAVSRAWGSSTGGCLPATCSQRPAQPLRAGTQKPCCLGFSSAPSPSHRFS